MKYTANIPSNGCPVGGASNYPLITAYSLKTQLLPTKNLELYSKYAARNFPTGSIAYVVTSQKLEVIAIIDFTCSRFNLRSSFFHTSIFADKMFSKFDLKKTQCAGQIDLLCYTNFEPLPNFLI